MGSMLLDRCIMGIALWGRFPWWGGRWPLGTKVPHNVSPKGRGGPWASPPRILFSKLCCFFFGDAFWGGGSWGGGPQKEYELRGGFYPGNWLFAPNQLPHHKLSSSSMTVLLSVLRRTLRDVSTNFSFPSWSVFLLVDTTTSLPQKVPTANHIHTHHQQVSHLLNR